MKFHDRRGPNQDSKLWLLKWSFFLDFSFFWKSLQNFGRRRWLKILGVRWLLYHAFREDLPNMDFGRVNGKFLLSREFANSQMHLVTFAFWVWDFELWVRSHDSRLLPCFSPCARVDALVDCLKCWISRFLFGGGGTIPVRPSQSNFREGVLRVNSWMRQFLQRLARLLYEDVTVLSWLLGTELAIKMWLSKLHLRIRRLAKVY